jgi:hypothetical protein
MANHFCPGDVGGDIWGSGGGKVGLGENCG